MITSTADTFVISGGMVSRFKLLELEAIQKEKKGEFCKPIASTNR
jgi:hypothetical protein